VGGVRRRLERLEEKSGYQRMTLVCPVCGEEFVVYGDVAVEHIVWEWSRGTDGTGHHKTPESMLRAFEHEHDPARFIEKPSGLPFMSREVSGMNLGGGAPHDA
jgi:hypothetical protein